MTPHTLHQSASPSRLLPPVWLYGFVVFAAAWLVFWIQPLAVRGVLPVLGGAPAVWNTAMVFFQAALLAGYAFAHVIVRHLSPGWQLALLCALWVAVAVTAPAGELRLLGEDPGGLPPVLWLLGTLAGALGLAFVAASSLTPLVQAWLARAGAGAASADPYVLYAASNAGSAGALVTYPFLIEPLIGLETQAWAWSAVLIGLAPLLIVLWLAAARGGAPAAAPAPAPASDAAPRAALPVVRILALSAIPSALLLAVTRHITTDVAAVPLLWIVPLALYLGTFVHAFARRTLVPQWLLARLLPLLLILIAVVYPLSRSILVFGFAHLLVFVVAALYCHGALARLRPPAVDLTRYYLLISSGGLIGGLLVALVAPLVFNDVHEHPIALALVAALLPAAATGLSRVQLATAAAALAIVVAGLALVLSGGQGLDKGWLSFGALALVVLFTPALRILRARPALLAGALLAVFFAPAAISQSGDTVVARERSFFGVYRVSEAEGVRTFHHGTTLHGAEWPRPDGSIESRTSYFGMGTPYSEVFGALARRPSPLAIGMVGLGTGSLACYARPGDEVRIYEIDPVVVRLAREHFAALRNCAPAASVAIGDARLQLERERTMFDVLALDAFTSDAIPVHLLTLEAFRIYLRVLAPEGVVAVQITNRHLDLEPVLAALAERIGLAGRIKRYVARRDVAPPQLTESSDLVILARDESTLQALGLDTGWVALAPPGETRVWSDDYASIVPLFRWR